MKSVWTPKAIVKMTGRDLVGNLKASKAWGMGGIEGTDPERGIFYYDGQLLNEMEVGNRWGWHGGQWSASGELQQGGDPINFPVDCKYIGRSGEVLTAIQLFFGNTEGWQDRPVRVQLLECADYPSLLQFEILGPWGGKREGAGAKPTSDKVAIIRVRRVVDTIYKKYEGDMKVARVRDGKCVHAWMDAQTYGTITTRDGRPWSWEGLTVEELKEAGFKYTSNEVLYLGVKSGKEYHQMDDGTWERMDDEGWTPVKGQVEIVE